MFLEFGGNLRPETESSCKNQTPGYTTYWKIIAKVPGDGPATFGKCQSEIAGVLEKVGGAVFRHV